MVWGPEKGSLHLDEAQREGRWIEGRELWKKLDQVPTLNVNVLDYLLVHPALVPDSWKESLVFFWGTIYLHRCGTFAVACLRWDGTRWIRHFQLLDRMFDFDDPAAVRAS